MTPARAVVIFKDRRARRAWASRGREALPWWFFGLARRLDFLSIISGLTLGYGLTLPSP